MIFEAAVQGHEKDLSELERLYDASFPDDEKIPFQRLIRDLSEDRKMTAYYEEGKLIGLSYLFLYEDIVYLSYICVEEELRDKGYGTRILRLIKEAYASYRIVVDIEEVKAGSKNEKERRRRKDFYLRSGFVSSGIFYHIYHVDYEILAANGTVKKEDWHALIRKHWGPFAETAVYY